MQISNPDNLVNRILTLWDTGIKDDTAIVEKIHSEFNISMEDSESALELTKTGLFRAQIISTSQEYPKSNLTSDPILWSALKIGLSKLGRPDLYEMTIKGHRSWWKFW